MALEDEIKTQQPEAPSDEEEAPKDDTRLTDEEEDDLAIAVMLAQNIIDDGGIEVIDQAVAESKDPGQVIGQFLMQLVSQMSEQLPRETQLSPRIYFAEGGWLEEISDYLQEQYDIDQKVMDRAEMFVAAQAQSMSQGQAQQAAQDPNASPQGGPPAAPVGQPPMPGGMG